MAKSKYEYVKQFERHFEALPNTWMVVRVDGNSFHKFTKVHDYQRPNDPRGLGLMDEAALTVMKEYPDVVMAYGESDEYSFILRPSADLFSRREAKIISNFVSLFTAAFMMNWPKFFPETPLQLIPHFDSRVVCYPSLKNLRDYLAWRQVDCHINSLNNSVYWALVDQGKMTGKDAQKKLSQLKTAEKHEAMFSLGINYNDLQPEYKKGTTIIRMIEERELDQTNVEELKERKIPVTASQMRRLHYTYKKFAANIIDDGFFEEYSQAFSDVSMKTLKEQFKKKLALEAKEEAKTNSDRE